MCGPGRNRGAVDANERSEDNFLSMKITQEVREFAAKQNAEVDNFLAAHPEPVGSEAGQNGQRQEEAEAGMAEMSERFREVGSELYVGAGGRQHD